MLSSCIWSSEKEKREKVFGEGRLVKRGEGRISISSFDRGQEKRWENDSQACCRAGRKNPPKKPPNPKEKSSLPLQKKKGSKESLFYSRMKGKKPLGGGKGKEISLSCQKKQPRKNIFQGGPSAREAPFLGKGFTALGRRQALILREDGEPPSSEEEKRFLLGGGMTKPLAM